MENKNEWRKVKLGEIAQIKGGKRLPKGTSLQIEKNSHPYIRIKDMSFSKNLELNSSFEYVPDDVFQKIKKYIVKKNDIILSIVGSIGLVNRIGNSLNMANLTENCVKIITSEKIIPDYLYYYLISNIGKEEIKKGIVGAVQPKLPIKNIENIELNIYSLNIQTKITKILSDIDEKIELNNKINDNLEKQLQLLYKSWFVDFIPFNKTIPSDWEEMLLSDIAEFINGYSYKGKELSKSNTAMATIKNFSRNGTFNSEGYKEIIVSEKVKSEHYLKNFDILVAHTDLTQNADIIGNTEMIFNKLNYQNIIFSMDLVKIIPKNKNISKFLLILLLKNSNFKNHCLGYVNGTTVLHLSKKALQEYKVFLPKNLEILNPLINLVSKIYEKFSLLSKENEKLTNLKNYLLPKLMNGEIDVENIEL